MGLLKTERQINKSDLSPFSPNLARLKDKPDMLTSAKQLHSLGLISGLWFNFPVSLGLKTFCEEFYLCFILSRIRNLLYLSDSHSRDARFGYKVGQIGPKWDKSGDFQIRFQCIWRPRAKCIEIWSEKASDLPQLEPIWPTLEPNLPSLPRHVPD